MTQRELAEELGLSYATVSRVFNGDPRVQASTRASVLAGAKRLGYKGNPLARALRMKRSFAIGLVHPNTPDAFWAGILSGMERRARETGYHVVICHRSADTPSREEIEFLLQRQVDALVFQPFNGGENLEFIRTVLSGPTPTVVLDNRLPELKSHFVGTDSHTGSRDACEHLLSLGHRRIACVAGPRTNHAAESRVQGYRQALAGTNEPFDSSLVRYGGWDVRDGLSGAEWLLGLPERPTAVLTVNDRCAMGLIRGLRSAGLRIPEDVSVIGYSGDPMGELLDPPLTTVFQPAEALGREVADMALELIASPHSELLCRELPDELVVRGTTAPPRQLG